MREIEDSTMLIFRVPSKLCKPHDRNRAAARGCIENKIPMIKSSNYGSSFVINSKGQVLFKSNNEFNIFKQ